MARKSPKREPVRIDRAKQRPPVPRGDELRDAISELGFAPVKRKRDRGKRHHVDDYREVVLNGGAEAGLADALLELTQETHANRSRLLPEERAAVHLPQGKTGGRKAAEQEAQQAARDLRDEMNELGVRKRTHYYTALERLQTGEIDRTYDVGEPPDPKR